MDIALTAFLAVLTMLLYAVPGFLMIKTRLVGEEGIGPLVKLLLYVCQPALTYYTLMSVPYDPSILWKMGAAFLFTCLMTALTLGGFFLLFRKKMQDARYRIYTIATALGNYGFFGVPILKALLPEAPEALAYATVCSIALNAIGWTVACSIVSLDTRYISAKKFFFNPTVAALFVVLPLFLLRVQVPAFLHDGISLVAEMSTPLCMIIMGMRLALSSPRHVFLRPMQYLIVGAKQILYPLAVFLVLLLLPIDENAKAAMYILACCPIASMTLSFAEMLGKGQESAASLVLLGTTASAVTLPLMVLLL